jgi:glucose/arabinose dehydrogenase
MQRLFLFFIIIVLVSCSTQTPGPLPASPTAPELASTTPPEVEPTDMPPTAVVEVDRLPDPTPFSWVPFVSGFSQPLDLQSAGDARLFVVEQPGVIKVIDGGEILAQPFLDIQRFVNASASEQGLLGLAFHPNYADNGRFFVNYTDRSGNTVVARFNVSSDPNLADIDSLRIILRVAQPYRNHNGGGMAFGPDGYLYIGVGDGGSADDPEGNGQKLDTHLGKLLRIDVDSADPYAVPPDNPFSGAEEQPEIWAYGLRNPWRFSFDHSSGDLYIGDVGQNQWEEIDFLPANAPAGANFGWNVREGAHPFAGDATDGLIDPVTEYGHGDGCSVTAGVVVHDPSLPTWDGVFLFGDYCTGLVWGLARDSNGDWLSETLFSTGYRISSFGVDQDGRVYLLDYEGGAIYRLEKAP